MERQTHSQTDGQIDRQIDRWKDRRTDRQIDEQTERKMDKQTDKWTEKQTDRWTNRQSDRKNCHFTLNKTTQATKAKKCDNQHMKKQKKNTGFRDDASSKNFQITTISK